MANSTVHMFLSFKEAEDFIAKYEVENNYTYIKRTTKSQGQHVVDTLEHKRLFFQDRRGMVVVENTGVPFVNCGAIVRECQHGPQRLKKTKRKDLEEHQYQKSKKRSALQISKKQDCQATVRMRWVCAFPEYRIDNILSKEQQKKAFGKLRCEFSGDTVQELRVYVVISGEHTGHVLGKGAQYLQGIDRRIILKIHELVDNGITDLKQVKTGVQLFVQSLQLETATGKSRRFNPTDKDIRNHMAIAQQKNRWNPDDQTNLQAFIENRKQEHPDESFHFQPSVMEEGNKVNMCFVHQTDFHKHLLCKYGNDCVLVDSTYKISRYDIPLFLIVVPANVGYFVAGSFMVERETTEDIIGALSIIKKWNPNWKPNSFMTDFDRREVNALESVFPDSRVYICEFHREQSWSRWLKKKEHKSYMPEVLSKLRRIAQSETEEVFEAEVEKLRSLTAYTDNADLRNWVQKGWLSEKERWVYCFRRKKVNLRVNTTNAVESQHNILKHKYLQTVNASRSLSSVVETLVQHFIPDGKEKYIHKNFQCLEGYRKYSSKVPSFMHNRPRPFLTHFMNRLGLVDEKAIRRDSHVFKVTSSDGCSEYICDMESEIPSCTCPDYRRYNWPCKHMIAIITCCPDFGWDSLCPSYRELPCFNLDNDIMEDKLDTDKTLPEVTVETPDVNIGGIPDSTLLSECRNVVHTIESGLFLLPEKELAHVLGMLENVDSIIQKCTPRVHGLPIRPSKKRRSKSTEKLSQSTKLKKSLSTDVQVDLDEDFVGDSTEAVMPEFFMWKFTEDDEEEVDRIWFEGARQMVLGHIGPHCLTERSFEFIKNTLSDEHNLMNYETVIGAHNEGGNHWTLMIIKPHSSEIIHCNPLGTLFQLEQQLIYHWYSFLKCRFDAGLEEVITGEWTVRSPEHARQIDGTSCGIYVLKFAENYLAGKSLLFQWTSGDLYAIRKYLALFLMSSLRLRRHSLASIQSDESQQIEREQIRVEEEGTQIEDERTEKDEEGMKIKEEITDIMDKTSEMKSGTERIDQRKEEETTEKDEEEIEVEETTKKDGEITEKDKEKAEVEEKITEKVKKISEIEEDITEEDEDGAEVQEEGTQVLEEGIQIVEERTEIVEKETEIVGEVIEIDSNRSELKEDGTEREEQKTETEKEEGRVPSPVFRRTVRPPQPKRKRSSFIYYSLKREKRERYCTCKKPDDGKLYWQCENCQNWFHPQCVGLTEEEEPDHFVCDGCKPDEQRKVTAEHSEKKEENKLTIENLSSIWNSIVHFLESVAVCNNDNCDEPEHQRHHSFTKAPLEYIRKEKKLFGFGSEVFDIRAVDWLHMHLRSLVTFHANPIMPAVSAKIPTLRFVEKKSRLYSLFLEYDCLTSYLIYIMHKEAMIFSLCSIKKWPYELAEERCLRSEMNSKAVFGK